MNDTPQPVSLTVGLTRVDVAGSMATVGTYACVCPPNKSVEVVRLPKGTLADPEFLSFTWRDVESKHAGRNDYLPLRPRAYDLRTPTITTTIGDGTVTFLSDAPALFVTYDHGGADIYSDNGFTLLHGVEKVLSVTRSRRSGPSKPPQSLKFLT